MLYSSFSIYIYLFFIAKITNKVKSLISYIIMCISNNNTIKLNE